MFSDLLTGQAPACPVRAEVRALLEREDKYL